MDLKALREGFEKRAPWITRFEIEGEAFGGWYPAREDGRLEAFLQRHPRPGRVLELGALEGGHSFRLAEAADEVLSIELQSSNLEKCRWLHETVFPHQNLRFIQADLDRFDPAGLGRFDAVYNSGLLYHLMEPWMLLQTLAPITRWMFLWTHVAPEDAKRVERGGYRGWLYREPWRKHPLRGPRATSFWPTREALLDMLRDSGFDQIEVIVDNADHADGPEILLECRSMGTEVGS